MRVVVLGAGVIGVTAAHELRKDGHEVTVVERRSAPASGTSFANAGLVVPGHSFTWASPQAPKILLKSLFDRDQGLRFRPRADPRLWLWTARFLRNCSAERSIRNTRRTLRLTTYSRDRLRGIADETGVAFHARWNGVLYLHRTDESLRRAAARMRVLTDEGADLGIVDPDEACRIDPALAAARGRIAGAVWSPGDGSGDARAFTRDLARHTAERGVSYRFDTAVGDFRLEGGRIAAVETSAGPVAGDVFVLATGVWSPPLARGLGLRLPIYPIKGYSVTLPIADGHDPPGVGGVDQDRLVAYTRFGNRMRVTATAEFAGYDTSHRPADFRHMLATARELFPRGADFESPAYWAGLRPMTPDDLPFIARAGPDNLVVNTGHGHMGWTMAAGSARIAADLVKGDAPAIPLDGLGLDR